MAISQSTHHTVRKSDEPEVHRGADGRKRKRRPSPLPATPDQERWGGPTATFSLGGPETKRRRDYGGDSRFGHVGADGLKREEEFPFPHPAIPAQERWGEPKTFIIPAPGHGCEGC